MIKAVALGLAITTTPTGFFNEDSSYTLYRNSMTDPNMRLHMATFDTADGDAYNNENCNLAAKLFQQQDGVKTRFWCEKGTFKK